MSLPSTPASHLPSSPTVSRSVKSDRLQPVTPQRLSRSNHSLYRSPVTPSTGTPYTPLSFRSSFSSNSSTLNTPASANGTRNVNKKLTFSASPAETSGHHKNKSLADIADNWRFRANENGIKVSSSSAALSASTSISTAESAGNDSEYGDDEASGFSDNIPTEPAHPPLLAPPFLSTYRRRAQSHSLPAHTSQPTSPLVARSLRRAAIHASPSQPTSPLARRTLRTLASPTVTSPIIRRAPLSAAYPRTNQNLNVLSTPPPNAKLVNALKLKGGSFTDPGQMRRREGTGFLGTQSQNTSLFDINENDSDYEYEEENIQTQEHSESYEEQDSQYEYEYMQYNNQYGYPYDIATGHQQQQQQQHALPNPNSYVYPYPQFSPTSPFYDDRQQSAAGSGDAFFVGRALGSINESVEHHFQHQHHNHTHAHPHAQYTPLPLPLPSYAQVVHQLPQRHVSNPTTRLPSPSPPSLTTCSVCSRVNPPALAILEPCLHPLCSACLTSALNIVGEKDMECAVCKLGVVDFKLKKGDAVPASKKSTEEKEAGDSMRGKSFMDPLFSSPGSTATTTSSSGVNLLRSAFTLTLDDGEENGNAIEEGDSEFGGFFGARASTPNGEKMNRTQNGSGFSAREECVVLRIDNVPWDITPPSIAAWLQQPVEHVHVLLDRKGKTMSHAFVEVKSEEIARAVLRGEGCGEMNVGNTKKNLGGQKDKDVIRMGGGRGSVLGKGRRARGVTVTRSGQEELMRALFPSWRGNFTGSRPSLAGLDNEHVISTLETGLMTDDEIAALLHLIKSPDSHFLKVPSLPFHSLISILSKFPADIDSRVFWSGNLRDMVYDVTYAAIQALLSRIDQDKPAPAGGDANGEINMELATQLVTAAMECKAFTSQQLAKFSDLLDSCSLSYRSSSSGTSSPPSDLRTPEGDIGSSFHPNMPRTPPPSHPRGTTDAFGALAREFGVESQLVEALAQRLSGM